MNDDFDNSYDDKAIQAKLTKRHTPGPWRIQFGVYEPERVYGIYAGTGEEYENRIVETDCGYYPPKLADALLIAAAPEMAEALEMGLEVVEAFYGRDVLTCDDASDEEKLFVRSARAALRKAGGL